MTPINEVEIFITWGIDFMGLFVMFYGMNYILVKVDYVFEWVEVAALSNNEDKTVG